ncbi:MAG: hypothetical protein MJA84_00360 [Firmicutes bacterium]|nr:hypothetical protein [Bacillota bacterium]
MSFAPPGPGHKTPAGDDTYAGSSARSFAGSRELIVASSRSPAAPSGYGAAAILAWYRTDDADCGHRASRV